MPRTGELPGLTGARGLACASVVLVHTMALTAPGVLLALHMSLLANAAVSFFFALSAFLLVRPYIRAITGDGAPPAWGRYARQRLLRIFPAYFVVFSVANFGLHAVFVSNAVFSEKVRSDAGSGTITGALRLIEQLTLTQNVVPGQIQTGINPAWSLTVELCFYAVLPLLGLMSLALVRRGTTRLRSAAYLPLVLIGVGLVSKCVDALWQSAAGMSSSAAQFGPYPIGVFSNSLLVSADCFGWGAAAAVLYVWISRGTMPRWLIRRIRQGAVGVLLVAFVVVAAVASSRVLLAQAAFAIASAAALILLTDPSNPNRTPRIARLLDFRPFRFLGQVSLSVYLWHYPVLLLAIREGWIGSTSFPGAMRSLAVVLAISVALSWVTYRLVEAPAMRWAARPWLPGPSRAPGMRGVSHARPHVAIVHDYLTQRGGAERVVLEMTRALPGATVYTSLYDSAATFPEFADVDVRVVPWLNRLSWLRNNHRLGVLLLPFAFGRLRIDADVVIASSSGWAHGVRTTGRLLVYCYSPARWLYQSRRYLGKQTSLAAKAALWLIRLPLRVWDRRAARRADLYLASSTVVRERIVAVYGRDATVVMPPLPDFAARLRALPPHPQAAAADWYLCVSRLMPYKNVAAIIEAFTASPQRRLVVVGDGPDRQRLAAMAGDNITFVSEVSDDELAELYRGCRALVAMSYEDFGLTPLEAAAAGRPSVVLRWGGYLDTMIENVTAVFVERPVAAAICTALEELERRTWDPEAIAAHADSFRPAEFARRLCLIVGALSRTADSAVAAVPAPAALAERAAVFVPAEDAAGV